MDFREAIFGTEKRGGSARRANWDAGELLSSYGCPLVPLESYSGMKINKNKDYALSDLSKEDLLADDWEIIERTCE